MGDGTTSSFRWDEDRRVSVREQETFWQNRIREYAGLMEEAAFRRDFENAEYYDGMVSAAIVALERIREAHRMPLECPRNAERSLDAWR